MIRRSLLPKVRTLLPCFSIQRIPAPAQLQFCTKSQEANICDSIIMNASVGNDEDLLSSTKNFIPQLTNKLHKGQAGRIAVIGGSEEYTGAPFFAGMSAMKVGADLCHIFCVRNASPVIKSYSPELIVHPVLDDENALDTLIEWAPRMHSFVIGPGLGKDPAIVDVVAKFIVKLKELDKPMIIDADGLALVTDNPELIRNYYKVILTPNSIEFSRLCAAVFGGEFKPVPSASAEKIRDLSLALGNVTILNKGATDVASNGRLVVCCAGGGSNRRCGGQGDLLSGALAVLFHWALAFGDKGGAPAPPELLATYVQILSRSQSFNRSCSLFLNNVVSDKNSLVIRFPAASATNWTT